MEDNNKKIGVLGYGEVGKAIASFYTDPLIKDIARDDFADAQLDVLHVCIPYQSREQFIDQVKFIIERNAQGALVIIHSSVGVGITEAIGAFHKMVVHSPVRGVHPNLKEGIQVFVKYIGADFSGAGRIAHEHFAEIGINTTVVYKTAATELMKLLDTTYYGLCIAFHDYAAKLCEHSGVSFEMVMKDANETYNKGYASLGKGNVVRPVLYPPEDSKIGGHCVIPNAGILLAEYGDDAILQAILRHK